MILDTLDNAFTKAAQRASVLVGMVGKTPYQLGMVMAAIPMLIALSYPLCWFNLHGISKAVGSKDDFLLSPFYMCATAFCLGYVIRLVRVSLKLCIKRQREWDSATKQGNLMCAPTLARDTLLDINGPRLAALLCLFGLCHELVSIVLVVFHLDPSFGNVSPVGRSPAVLEAIYFCQYSLTMTFTASIAHTLLNDYLLLSTPRMRTRRQGSRVPNGHAAGA